MAPPAGQIVARAGSISARRAPAMQSWSGTTGSMLAGTNTVIDATKNAGGP
jgi:hypothetical protein